MRSPAERRELARRFLFITGDTANPKPFATDALPRAVQEVTA